jgi:hypothetical protein
MDRLIIESPYRSLSRPLLAYIDTMRELYPEDTLTVILPDLLLHTGGSISYIPKQRFA